MNSTENEILKQIDAGEQNLTELESAIDSTSDIEFLSRLAEIYNWDDGFSIPQKIAQHPLCGKGLALKLFWLAEGISLISGEIERNEYNSNWADLCESLKTGLLTGRYKSGDIEYDPSLSKVQTYKFKKANIPSVLYEPVD